MKTSLLICVALIACTFCSEHSTEPKESYQSWPPKNIDTTSHDFIWEIDTLEFPGTFQIIPKAIWGADTNDVWMVAHSDDWHARIWHWDGDNWSAYTESGLGTSPTDMIGFAHDDIWFCAIRTGDNPLIKTIQHWNGDSWNIVSHNIETDILSMWGSSSQDLYFGLINGNILHYDGSTFLLINTQTNGQIVNMVGNSNDVYAVSIKTDTTRRSKHYWILKLNDNVSSIVNYYEDTALNDHLPFPSSELSVIDNHLFGVNSRYVYSFMNPNLWGVIYSPVTKGAWNFNGSRLNNIFIAGYLGSSIFHFNGKKWKNFKQLQDLDFFSSSIKCFEDQVFICGYFDNMAFVLRGNRW